MKRTFQLIVKTIKNTGAMIEECYQRGLRSEIEKCIARVMEMFITEHKPTNEDIFKTALKCILTSEMLTINTHLKYLNDGNRL